MTRQRFHPINLWVATCLLLVATRAAAEDPCREAAEAILANNTGRAELYYTSVDAAPVVLGTLPNGMSADDLRTGYALSQDVANRVVVDGYTVETTVVDGTHVTCPGLVFLKFNFVHDSNLADTDKVRAMRRRDVANTVANAGDIWPTANLAREFLVDTQVVRPGSVQGASEVAAEALQILGQIVVDRASNQAYRLLKAKITEALGCGSDCAPLKLSETCEVLEALRLQDLATAPEPLVEALTVDLVAHLLEGSVKPSDEFNEAIANVARLTVKRLLRGGVDGVSDSDVELIVAEIIKVTVTVTTRAAAAKPAGWQVGVVAGVLALGACMKEDSLGSCGIQRWVDQITDKLRADGPQRALARALAADLFAALTMQAAVGKPPTRERFVRVVDVLLRIGCAWTASGGNDSPRCLDLREVTNLTDFRSRLALFSHAVRAIMDRDHAALVVVGVKTMELALPATTDKLDRARYKKGMTLLGAVLQYAATYTKDADGEGAHEARTKILESLTASMTDRSGRHGDTIVSLGGSLRGLAGGRFSTAESGKQTIAGPLSLPLGFALDHIGESHVGFHGELGFVDLGQYVTLDTESEVSEPDPRAAFAPSLTLALGVGVEFPFFVGVAAGWSPFVRATEEVADDDNLGSVYVGGVAGFYVPLIDLN